MSQNQLFKERMRIGLKKMFDYFLQGLLYTAPLGLTLYFGYLLYDFLDSRVQSIFISLFDMRIPGLGIVIIFLVVSLMGYVIPKLLTRPVTILFNKLLSKVPIVETVFSSIKDFLSAFIGKEKKFNQPVRIKINSQLEIEKLGFITQEDLSVLGLKEMVAVYVPFSYSFMGDLLIVPTAHVTHIDAPAADVMKFVVSGGVTKF